MLVKIILKWIPNTITYFFPNYIQSAVLSVTVFLFYWFGKREFGKFTNGIPVIGKPVRPPSPLNLNEKSEPLVKDWNVKGKVLLFGISEH